MSTDSYQFPTAYQQFVFKSRYARYLQDEGRREDWEETVARYLDFFKEHLKDNVDFELSQELYNDLFEAIASQAVMPSMRALMTAGVALKRDNVAGYNCAFLGFEQPKSFDEEMFILMNGTGVGFSVESDFTTQLPIIAEDFYDSDTVIVVDDSRIGWTKAFRELLTLLYTGQVPKWDLSRLRPAGARLKIFGGRSSGPEPLNQLFKFTVEMFKRAAGRRLTTIECHDLGCMVANIVVVGGVRRSALISLSDLTDDKMRDAKSGAWWNVYGYRRLANNSAVYEERPDVGVFIREWLSLYDSKSGERGIFNRAATKRVIENANDFRVKLLGSTARLREIGDWIFGTNPCSEIILRAMQFCNLTEIVVREEDDIDTLLWKVRIATILGTFQSTLTNFKYLNSKWKKNCEDERLLGVSMTGILDNPILNGGRGRKLLAETLELMKAEAIKVNHELATTLGINPSAAITCVKPSGTVSSLVNSASGIHARHAPYYIRYVRNSVNDPVTHFLKDAGVPWEADVMDPNNTVCFKYPIKSPTNAVYKSDLSAIDHLELWKVYQIHWCEHKPSITVTVKEHEWLEVGAWVYKNFEWMSGISFLPDDGNHTYQQAPFTTCTKEEYEALMAQIPNVDWSQLPKYEKEDATTGTQELACTAGGCEI